MKLRLFQFLINKKCLKKLNGTCIHFVLRYRVVEAVDGVDAYEKAQAQSFDLVLTDQNMPRLDGLGLTRKLRDHPQFKTIPILMLTTESSDLMKQAGRAAGATGWLVKPFDPARLLEVIKKVIK